MNYSRILRRSLEITWLYRALWVFGFILALTAARSGGSHGGGGGGGGAGSSFTVPGNVVGQAALRFFDQNAVQAAAIAVILVVLVLLLVVLFTVARVVAETALIRMVNNYEGTGARVSVGQGFRLGWSRAALRIFLIDLLIFVVLALVFLLVFTVAAAPLLALLSNSETVKVIGVTAAAGLLLLALGLLVAAVLAVSVLLPFFHRACVLENRGVIASFRRGWDVARGRAVDVIVMALLLFVIGLGLALVFIPVLFVLLFGGAAVAGIPGVLTGLIASLFLHGQGPVALGLAVGLPIFLLIVLTPLLFLSGLAQVFTSSAWTLTYRDLLALEAPQSDLPAAA